MRKMLVSMICVLFFSGMGTCFAGQDCLVVAYQDFRPFHFMSENGEMAGILHDILMEALEKRMGILTKWEAYPWGRCQEKVRDGSCDAMITVPTAERLEYAVTNMDPVYEKSRAIFTYSGHPRMEEIQSIKSLDDIKRAGLTVVTYLGNGWNESHIRARGIPVQEASSLQSVWLMLAYHRGDIVIEWPGGAWPDIRSVGMETEVVQTKVNVESVPFHLLVGKSSQWRSILPRFNAVIQSMHRDGTVKRIVDIYR